MCDGEGLETSQCIISRVCLEVSLSLGPSAGSESSDHSQQMIMLPVTLVLRSCWQFYMLVGSVSLVSHYFGSLLVLHRSCFCL